MDYASSIELIRYKTWDDFLEQTRSEESAPRIVLLSTKASSAITEFEFRADDILLFGRESAGVPKEVHDASDARVHIPISKNARSLNLVTSASIALFEGLRQTGF